MSRSKYYDKTSSQWVHSDKAGLPANVFPTFDDLRVNNGTELQIKASATGKTLGQCDLGETVYLPETISGVKDFHEYIVVAKNQGNVENVVLLRKYVDSQGIFGAWDGFYHNSSADTFCTNTMATRLGTAINSYKVNMSLKVRGYSSNIAATIDRSIFIPSQFNLTGGATIEKNEDTTWFSSEAERIGYLESNHNTAVKYWTRTFGDTGASKRYFVYVATNGGTETQRYDSSAYYRPAISLTPSMPLNGSNQFISDPTYANTIDTIKRADDLYKLKDLDARDSIATLETAVAGKAAASHTHTVSDITDFPTIPTAGTITSGSTGYATGGDVYTAINKPRYDLTFIADSDSLIDSRTTGAVVTNAYLTALVPLDELLLKSDRYDKVELCGGFHYTDPNLGFLTIVPATLSYNAIIPNQVAQQMLPTVVSGATINSKDALLVRITPVYNDDAYQGSFVIWEDENDVRQIELVGT